MIYGYCRVSTREQKIERQINNIKEAYPEAVIIKEIFTGRKIERKGFKRLLGMLEKGDIVVFDSVSRMSRNAEQGFALYQELFNKGIELIFLKENYINTATYKKALTSNIEMTNTSVDIILKGINQYLLTLAEEQIKIAFNQSEKEVADLRQRTREGMLIAKLNGKQIGAIKGKKLITKKSLKAKEDIKKYSKSFGGNLNDIDVIKLIGISRNTYYKYKKELIENYI